ncbi:hypothetical protein V9K67_13620 [Paraflavisolibacter sp. H34]|uniref:hypothetical protein n=1 Tax=Huijunlia imazamoxiresistens TaxID=3127457 RepID=UPI003016A3B3
MAKNSISSFLKMLPVVLSLAAAEGAAQAPKKASSFPDSVTVAASDRYQPATFLRRWIMGNNYRREWHTPVTLPVFRLAESGLTPTEMGGGQQTKSLRLTDNRGREWALRTVDKDAKGALPLWARKTFLNKIVQDMISAAHPYAAVTVGYLAHKAGIMAPRPTLYYVPDDGAFGKFREPMGGTVCMLEEREPTHDGSETAKTDDVLELIVEENDQLVLQRRVLRARLLDMLSADWDRHADQWRWGAVDSGKVTYYYAIPRDRDQAFFHSDGLLPWLARLTAMRHISRFTWNAKGLKPLNIKSRHFDRVFLNGLDARAWKAETEAFCRRLPDSVIIAAVKQLPPEIFALDSALLVGKLISRRDALGEKVLEYYRHLAEGVQVHGSDEGELFRVKGDKDKNITVTVHRYKEGRGIGRKLYERTFLPGETRFIYLLGFQGDDTFEIDEAASSQIRILMYGGEGKDRYNLQGAVRSRVYDRRSDNNEWIHRSHAKVHLR